MRIGELRHLVYLQTPFASRTERGAEAIAWSDQVVYVVDHSGNYIVDHASNRLVITPVALPLRAKIRTANGDERQSNDQTIPVAAHEVTLRWPLPDGMVVTTKSRLKWLDGGVPRFFSILAIGEPDNRGRLIVLTCQELINESRGL